MLVLTACGQGESIVEPGPGDTEQSTTTTADPASEEGQGDDENNDEVVTDGDLDTTSTTIAPADGSSGDDAQAPPSTFVIDEDSENAAVFTELAVSGLVLSLEEQSCADDATQTSVDAGEDELDAVIGAVQECASPSAVDDFASILIVAGGRSLPATEAACVSSRLRATEEYRPFWTALLEEEPFDFLLADREVQNRYLDLFTECVSVGRAVAEQANAALSPATMGCIDALYTDREFVRVTIEADLSGDPDERQRIDGQIAGCLTAEERDALAGN